VNDAPVWKKALAAPTQLSATPCTCATDVRTRSAHKATTLAFGVAVRRAWSITCEEARGSGSKKEGRKEGRKEVMKEKKIS
jgi:hypothetical protein